MHDIGTIRRRNEEATALSIGPFKVPNLAARIIITDTCQTIVETCRCSNYWTDPQRDVFALGYVRGRLDQLKTDANSATTAFAATLLAQVNVGGIEFIRCIVRQMTGNDWNYLASRTIQ